MTVKQKQCLLAYLGYYAGEIDGLWGPMTQQATEAFQHDYQLRVDGVYGDGTQAKAVEVIASGEPSIIQRQGDDTQAAPPSIPEDDDAAFWATIPNFDKSEFTCHCGCGLNNVDHGLVGVCQRLRDYCNARFIITSPCRCPENNARAGGVWNSKHLASKEKKCRAVDFYIEGKTAVEVQAVAQAQPEIRYSYCIDGSAVHMEMY